MGIRNQPLKIMLSPEAVESLSKLADASGMSLSSFANRVVNAIGETIYYAGFVVEEATSESEAENSIE